MNKKRLLNQITNTGKKVILIQIINQLKIKL